MKRKKTALSTGSEWTFESIERYDREIGRALLRAARGWGFALSQSTVEAEGVCEACAAA